MKIKFTQLFNQSPDDTGGGATPPEAPTGIMGDGLAFRENWFNDVQDPAFDEFRSMAAQFKDIPSVFKSLKETKTAFQARQEGMVKLPGEKSTPEEIAAYHKALGVPGRAEEYKFKVPTLPGGLKIEEAHIKGFSEFAHKNGIPQAQAQAILEYQAGLEAQEIAAIEAEEKEFAKASEQKLRDEWGMSFDKNMLLAQRAAKTFGVSEQDAKNPELLRIMQRVAGAISEDKLASPGDVGGILSAGNEARDIVKNDRNPLYAIYWDSAHPRHQEVVQLVLKKQMEQTSRG
jgi:hypothetical protein